MKFDFPFLLIFSLCCPFFAGEIAVSGIESEVREKTSEERIRQNLEVLERIERSKSDASGKLNSVESGNSGNGNAGIDKKVDKTDDNGRNPAEKKGENAAVPTESEESATYGKIRELADQIENEDSEFPRTVVERTPEGVRISIRNIQFKPDSAALLESERPRLDEIAQILRAVPSTKIIVEGHTASVGEARNEFWDKGAGGGLIGSEMDAFTLPDDLEKALSTGEPQFWESWPDPDVCVSVFPNADFPRLNERAEGRSTIIISPDSYQFKDNDAYSGNEGVSFVLTPTNLELKKFIADLREEAAKIREKAAPC